MSYEGPSLVVAGIFAILSAIYGLKKRGFSLPPPPSPGGSYPIVGHAFVLPTNEEHQVYAKWSKELNSDIISLKVFGQTIVILSSAQSAFDLLDHRSAIYSDRPQLRVLSDPDLLDSSYSTVTVPYGDRWRKQRRMTHEVLKSSVNDQHFARMETETRAMIKRMLTDPTSFEKEVRRNVAAQIMLTVYGYTVTSADDYFVQVVQTTIECFSQAAMPANFLVNFIPWLKYVPEWIPGTGWRGMVREWCRLRDAMIQEPYAWAKSQISAGTALPSMVRTHLSNVLKSLTMESNEEEDCLKWAAGSLFGAMIRYPELQARAQREIDDVVGRERLPEVNDRSNMPYMRNIVREALRWQPVLPLGFPRASTKDDIYKGYFIPKGSVVMTNTWAISRDESVYANPEVFNPDRFLDTSVPDAPAFGMGRRMCPGNSFAEASLFITFASLLAVFTIGPRRDLITGGEIIPEPKMTTNALVSHPLPFDCVFEPRSDVYVKLLEGL